MLHNCCSAITYGLMFLETLDTHSHKVKAQRQGVKCSSPILHSQVISPRRGRLTLTCRICQQNSERECSEHLLKIKAHLHLRDREWIIYFRFSSPEKLLVCPFSLLIRKVAIDVSTTMITTTTAVYRICQHSLQSDFSIQLCTQRLFSGGENTPQLTVTTGIILTVHQQFTQTITPNDATEENRGACMKKKSTVLAELVSGSII